MTERRPIPGFPNYQADASGFIWSVCPGRWGRNTEPRRMALWVDGDGYSHVTLYRDGKRIRQAVHILVAVSFHGPRPDGMVVAHLKGLSAGNGAENLAYVTPKENIAHKLEHGTQPLGERCHLAKVSDDDAKLMLKLSGMGVPNREIMKTFGVSRSYLPNLKAGHFRRRLAA